MLSSVFFGTPCIKYSNVTVSWSCYRYRVSRWWVLLDILKLLYCYNAVFASRARSASGGRAWGLVLTLRASAQPRSGLSLWPSSWGHSQCPFTAPSTAPSHAQLLWCHDKHGTVWSISSINLKFLASPGLCVEKPKVWWCLWLMQLKVTSQQRQN